MIFGFFNKLSNSRSKTISSAALVVAFFGFLSRVLGLWRDRILAGQFGAGETLDIYYASFKIPDLVYNLLIVGAVSSAFLPIFYEYLNRNKNEAWRLASNTLNLLLFSLVVFSGILIVFAPLLVRLVAPGFSSEALAETVRLSRIMFLSPFLLGLSALVSSLLQAFSRFLITALAPIFYNLGIIFGALFLVPQFGIIGLAYGVVGGALFHLLIQLPVLFSIGFKWQGIFNLKESGLKRIIKMWAPRTLSLFAFQASNIVVTAIASGIAAGSIAIFNLADNLRSVPYGIIGVAFSTAAFPALNSAFAQGNKDLFLRRFSLAVRQTLFIVVPLTFLFFILRAQIVRLILGTGHFGWEATRLTAASLGLFALGIFASSLLPLFTRAFFVFHNTRIPVVINVVSMAIQIFLSLLFVGVLTKSLFLSGLLASFLKVGDLKGVAVLGLPLALSLAAIINLVWHWIDLKKHVGDFGISEIKKSFFKILASSILASVFTYLGLYIFNNFFNTRTVLGLLGQTSLALILGGIVYLVSVFLFEVEEISMFGIRGSLFNWRGVVRPEPRLNSDTLDDQY